MAKSKFRWRPVGGLGEVGMNTMVFTFGDLCVPVDAGIAFADPNDYGIEAVFPDYREILLKERPPVWVITHAHEDHIGAVPSIFEICAQEGIAAPEVWAPPLAAALIRERMSDGGRSSEAKNFRDRVIDIEPGTTREIRDLKIHFLRTRHSTLDTCSVAFDWSGGERPLRIVHTADFKLDSHRFEDGTLALEDAYGVFTRRGLTPDMLFIDSTNAERPGHSVSEADLLPGLEKLIADAQGRVFLTLFSSNIQRIAALVAIGARLGRTTCLAGRSMQTAHRIAQELGIYGSRCQDLVNENLRDLRDISRLPRNQQLVICSGSQGESRSVLMKMSQGTHPEFNLGSDDRVIFSSKLIPGNERSVGRLVNGLLRTGAEVLMGDTARELAGGPVHASGHARRDEIAAVMRYLKPRYVIPVHGELRHLRSCASIAHEHGSEWNLPDEHVPVVENGTELIFESSNTSWDLVERIHTLERPARMLRFEDFSAPSRDAFLRVRKRAASAGIVSLSLDTMGRVNFSIEGVFPETMYQGRYREGIDAQVRDWAFAKYRQLVPKNFRERDETLCREMADDLARHFRRLTGARPYVIVHLTGG
ncbi:MAG: ribonuclease J [Bdellovibrionales bacterium]|nr:ribonuclease J [Bdellovibrionales bacterium]